MSLPTGLYFFLILHLFFTYFLLRIIALQNFVVFCQPQHELATGTHVSPPF